MGMIPSMFVRAQTHRQFCRVSIIVFEFLWWWAGSQFNVTDLSVGRSVVRCALVRGTISWANAFFGAGIESRNQNRVNHECARPPNRNYRYAWWAVKLGFSPTFELMDLELSRHFKHSCLFKHFLASTASLLKARVIGLQETSSPEFVFFKRTCSNKSCVAWCPSQIIQFLKNVYFGHGISNHTKKHTRVLSKCKNWAHAFIRAQAVSVLTPEATP